MAFTFIATMVYELSPETSAEGKKLLRAQLVGRRWFDRHEGKRVPDSMVWARKTNDAGETVDVLKAQCERELLASVDAVAALGVPIRLARAWIQVSGAGSYGPVALE